LISIVGSIITRFFDKNTQKPRIMGLFLSVHDSGYSSLLGMAFFFFKKIVKNRTDYNKEL
ncbi:hypothetical protein PDN41_31295, partial [Bacillus cereus]|nr:hypothetical protein [Bacillus cereus]